MAMKGLFARPSNILSFLLIFFFSGAYSGEGASSLGFRVLEWSQQGNVVVIDHNGQISGLHLNEYISGMKLVGINTSYVSFLKSREAGEYVQVFPVDKDGGQNFRIIKILPEGDQL
jgi:hypothetical protein